MDNVKDLNLEDFRKKFVKSMKFLNNKAQKEALIRSRDLDVFFEKFNSESRGINPVEDLPKQEFHASLQRYILCFFGDAIYHACFAVELALLVRLDEKLPLEKKNEINEKINTKNGKPLSFTFGTMFNLAQEKQIRIIKDEKIRKKIVDLLEKRNRYIHVNNFLSGLILTFKKQVIPKLESTLADIEEVENMGIAGQVFKRTWFPNIKRYLNEQLQLLNVLPDFSWCTQDKYLKNIEKQICEYITELNKLTDSVDTSTLIEKIKTARKIKGLTKEILSTTFIRCQSLEIMEAAFDILLDLDFFKKEGSAGK